MAAFSRKSTTIVQFLIWLVYTFIRADEELKTKSITSENFTTVAKLISLLNATNRPVYIDRYSQNADLHSASIFANYIRFAICEICTGSFTRNYIILQEIHKHDFRSSVSIIPSKARYSITSFSRHFTSHRKSRLFNRGLTRHRDTSQVPSSSARTEDWRKIGETNVYARGRFAFRGCVGGYVSKHIQLAPLGAIAGVISPLPNQACVTH